MRLVVTGSRDWSDKALLYRVLDEIHARYSISVLFHGKARGADTMAEQWALERGVSNFGNPYPPAYGQRGGTVRNGWLLDEAALLGARGVLVVAFPMKHSTGTWNCVTQAKQRGLDIRLVRDHIEEAGT